MKRATIALFLLLIAATPVLGDYKAGILAAKKQNYSKALSEFLPLAERGHSGAQYSMGIMYLHGRGVERDMKKALELFFKASEQEHPAAMNNLGRLYVDGTGVMKDYVAAVRWFRKAAKKHLTARNNLAQMYLTGRGVDKDYKKALYWLQQAAKNGHAKSTYEIGIMYESGLGVEADPGKALEWIQKAAEKKYRKAVTWIGRKEHRKRAEERKRRVASVTYHCPQIPTVSWWEAISHADVIIEVSRMHQRNWNAYAKKWARHLRRMEILRERGKGVRMRRNSVDLSKGEISDESAITDEHVTLGGTDLDRYIVKIKQRITAHHCLAQETAARQAQKK